MEFTFYPVGVVIMKNRCFKIRIYSGRQRTDKRARGCGQTKMKCNVSVGWVGRPLCPRLRDDPPKFSV